VVVTVPRWVPGFVVERFVREHADWITGTTNSLQKKSREIIRLPTTVAKSFKLYKENTRTLVEKRLTHIASLYGVKFGRISIRNQKSRWGSCSKRGNLNFNFKIFFLSKELQDYIVVHEVCHLLQFNHSKKFWDLVGWSIPDYKNLRKRLKNIRVV
jgi:hypothetical protein